MSGEQALTAADAHSIAFLIGSLSCDKLTAAPLSILRKGEMQKPIGFGG